jgi:hypothetical protein
MKIIQNIMMRKDEIISEVEIGDGKQHHDTVLLGLVGIFCGELFL